MVYKILGKFDTYMFWSQYWRSLEWKPLNGPQGVKEGLIWYFARFIQYKLGWFWIWWMIQDHFSFILSLWYIILCCEKHIPRYRNLDKAGHVKELKDKGHVIPIKLSELDEGWFISDDQLTYFFSKARDRVVGGGQRSRVAICSRTPTFWGIPSYTEEVYNRTERQSISESSTNRNHAPVV